MGTRREFINQTIGLTAAAATVNRALSADAAMPSATRGIMKTYKIPRTDLEVSRIAAGLDGYAGDWNRKPLNSEMRARADRGVNTAYENGITLFDNADIYAYGKCE